MVLDFLVVIVLVHPRPSAAVAILTGTVNASHVIGAVMLEDFIYHTFRSKVNGPGAVQPSAFSNRLTGGSSQHNPSSSELRFHPLILYFLLRPRQSRPSSG